MNRLAVNTGAFFLPRNQHLALNTDTGCATGGMEDQTPTGSAPALLAVIGVQGHADRLAATTRHLPAVGTLEPRFRFVGAGTVRHDGTTTHMTF